MAANGSAKYGGHITERIYARRVVKHAQTLTLQRQCGTMGVLYNITLAGSTRSCASIRAATLLKYKLY